MSTRSHVTFHNYKTKKDETGRLIKDGIQKKPDYILYFHMDGYPSGILPYLIPFLFAFQRNRGLSDTSYAAAWCMHHMIKSRGYDYYNIVDMGCLSNGISNGIHGDIEFLYEVTPDELIVKEVSYGKKQRFKTILTIPITKEDEWNELKIKLVVSGALSKFKEGY
jgi:hypothetical protein